MTVPLPLLILLIAMASPMAYSIVKAITLWAWRTAKYRLDLLKNDYDHWRKMRRLHKQGIWQQFVHD